MSMNNSNATTTTVSSSSASTCSSLTTTTNVDNYATDNNNSIAEDLVDFDDMINFKPSTTSKGKVNKKSTATTNMNQRKFCTIQATP